MNYIGGKILANRKMMMFVIFFVGLLFVSAVGASDNSTVDDAVLEKTDNDLYLNENNTFKTFTDLDSAVNNKSNSEVYLTDDYRFDSEIDLKFKDRDLIIGHDVIIYGNGHTIDGNYQNPTLHKLLCKVVLYDIKFINSKSASIYDIKAINCTFINCKASAMCYGTAINCTFINNTNDYFGGAISDGNAINCTFINNSAGDGGGAVFNGIATNCTFINNYAWFGGAVSLYSEYYDPSDEVAAINCTFIGNRAINGGAVYNARAVNCKFVENYAELGGAILRGSSINCTFKGNSAKSGGAIADTCAANCAFTNNTADNGGASFRSDADNCSFTKNHASKNGGGCYNGTAENCIFKDNVADVEGNDTYNTLYKPFLSCDNFMSVYGSNDTMSINLTSVRGLAIYDANVTIRVYKNKTLIGTYYCLSEAQWGVTLDAGDYVAVLSVENQSYDVDSINVTIKVNKIKSKITSQAISAVFNQNKCLTVNLFDEYGNPISNANITIDLNGKKTLPTNSEGKAELSVINLIPNSYIAKVTFCGNQNYVESSLNVKVTVKKATPKLTAKAKTFKKSLKTKKFSVTLKNNLNKVMKNTKVTLKVNKKTFTAKTTDKGVATFKITKLTKKGKYTATVKYVGSKYYNAKSVNVKITVK